MHSLCDPLAIGPAVAPRSQTAIRAKFNAETNPSVAVPGWPAKATKIFLDAVDNALAAHDEPNLEIALDLLVSANHPPPLVANAILWGLPHRCRPAYLESFLK